MIDSEQIRAGRGLLDWSQKDLSERVGISQHGLRAIEKGTTNPKSVTLEKIVFEFAKQGVEIIPGGVRRAQNFITYKGEHGFREFMDDVYEVARTTGGDIILFNTDPAVWMTFHGKQWVDDHIKRMTACSDNFTWRATVCEGNELEPARAYGEYRTIPKEFFTNESTYVYGDRFAAVTLSDNIEIKVMRSQDYADSFRKLFNLVWDHIAIDKRAST